MTRRLRLGKEGRRVEESGREDPRLENVLQSQGYDVRESEVCEESHLNYLGVLVVCQDCLWWLFIAAKLEVCIAGV
jgi:hypothetical protein